MFWDCQDSDFDRKIIYFFWLDRVESRILLRSIYGRYYYRFPERQNRVWSPNAATKLFAMAFFIQCYKNPTLFMKYRGQVFWFDLYFALKTFFNCFTRKVYRYFWRSDDIQRQQIKWVMYTLLLIVILIGGVVIPFAFRPPDPTRLGPDLIVAMIHLCLFRLSFALVFAAIGVAMLRYRLWDIDVIIRRTLQYSVLSGLLALTYFGLVIVLQSVFTAITGQQQNDFVTVASTLALAALFNPVRRRVQDVIDRRFYRKKYDAAKTLAAFAATCRDETDLDKLTARLVEVVQETMQPEHVSLWLKPSPPNPLSRRFSSGEGGGVARSAGVGGEG